MENKTLVKIKEYCKVLSENNKNLSHIDFRKSIILGNRISISGILIKDGWSDYVIIDIGNGEFSNIRMDLFSNEVLVKICQEVKKFM